MISTKTIKISLIETRSNVFINCFIQDNDPIGRLNLAQNSSWNPITTFFKLLRCAVPVPLKADILLTLASLAKSPEVANEIWQTMEATNIICTTPASGNYQPKGLQVNTQHFFNKFVYWDFLHRPNWRKLRQGMRNILCQLQLSPC